jgi:flagellar basal body P-ring protein FlgI
MVEPVGVETDPVGAVVSTTNVAVVVVAALLPSVSAAPEIRAVTASS